MKPAAREQAATLALRDFQRGVKAAAEIAGQHNRRSSHKYRLDDCILCKFNVTKRDKPRLNKHRLDEWTRGYAVAVAEMNRMLDNPTSANELLRAAGITPSMLRSLGLDEYDMAELAKCLPKRRGAR